MNIDNFFKTFDWYRNISIKLIQQIPTEYLTESINHRSMNLHTQFTDFGYTELVIIGKLIGKNLVDTVELPKIEEGKDGLLHYVNACHTLVKSELVAMDYSTNTLDWWGRFTFDFEQALTFLLAHEAMHHGEILSFVYAKDLVSPEVFQNTWGLH